MTRMEQQPMIITLDGPAGVGKSTLAKRVAARLGVAYLDTGAMFRTAALVLKQRGVLVADASDYDGAALAEALSGCVFTLEGSGEQTKLFCNGRLVGDAIRTEEVGMLAARIAGNAQVRDFLKQAQQRLGGTLSLVAEGRDMGTVVFPNARCKIFLDADPDVRADRRCRQLRELGEPCDRAALKEQIRRRDEQDRNRAIAPLRPASDARLIDTSHKDIEAVFADIMHAVSEAAHADNPPDVPLRRKDRAMPREDALALLARAEYGVLAVDEGKGWPYAVPLSFVLMDGALYVHSACEGRKIAALERNDRVCFTVVGATKPVYVTDFTTYYESVVVQGRATPVTDEREKYESLIRLAEKYLPEHMDKAERDIRRSFKRTAVVKISLDLVTGKAKRPK